MKVKAVTNVKYDGNWYAADEVFDVREADLAEMDGLAEKVGKTANPPAPDPEPVEGETTASEEEKPRKRSRKR